MLRTRTRNWEPSGSRRSLSPGAAPRARCAPCRMAICLPGNADLLPQSGLCQSLISRRVSYLETKGLVTQDRPATPLPTAQVNRSSLWPFLEDATPFEPGRIRRGTPIATRNPLRCKPRLRPNINSVDTAPYRRIIICLAWRYPSNPRPFHRYRISALRIVVAPEECAR